MAVTQEKRFGTDRWSAGSDPWPARAGWNTLLDKITTTAGIWLEGTFAARPAFDALMFGRLYWATDQQRLYVQSHTAWVEVSPVGGGGVPLAVANGGDGSEGSSRIAARANHVHPEPPWSAAIPLAGSWAQYGGASPRWRIVGRMAQLTGAARYTPAGGIGATSVQLTAGTIPSIVPPAYSSRELWMNCLQGLDTTATSSLTPDGAGAVGVMSDGTLRLKRGPFDGAKIDVFVLDGITWRID